MIAPNDLLRRQAIEVFDRTFTVTYALEAVAIVVAMLGAANSLLALVLDRRREIGLIRYLGRRRRPGSPHDPDGGGPARIAGRMLGLALGMALSLVLIYVVNKQSFGWTIQFHPPALAACGRVVAGLGRNGSGRCLPGAVRRKAGAGRSRYTKNN